MEQRDSSALEIMRRELGAHPKLRQLQREAILLLEETVGESAGFEVRQLLTAACGIPGAMLGPCGEREIPEEEAARFSPGWSAAWEGSLFSIFWGSGNSMACLCGWAPASSSPGRTPKLR